LDSDVCRRGALALPPDVLDNAETPAVASHQRAREVLPSYFDQVIDDLE